MESKIDDQFRIGFTRDLEVRSLNSKSLELVILRTKNKVCPQRFFVAGQYEGQYGGRCTEGQHRCRKNHGLKRRENMSTHAWACRLGRSQGTRANSEGMKRMREGYDQTGRQKAGPPLGSQNGLSHGIVAFEVQVKRRARRGRSLIDRRRQQARTL